MTRPVEEKAAAIVGGVDRRVVFLICAEKCFLITPTVVFDPSADDDGHRRVRCSAGLDVGEVNPAVFRVVGMHGDIEETAVLFHVNRGEAGDRCRVELAVRDDAEAADALGHEHPAVGQKCDAPRRLETGHHSLEAKRVALARDRELGRWRGNRDATAQKFIALPLQVGDETVDFFLRKDAAKRRHAGLRPTVGDTAPNVGLSSAMVPKIVEEVGRRDAREVSAVTIHADLGDDFFGSAGRRGRCGGEGRGDEQRRAGDEGAEGAAEKGGDRKRHGVGGG